jgi:hypothetical protein
MNMRRRSHRSLLIALAVVAAVTVALVLRQKAPPEAARLLPESDAIVYVHLKTVRSATHFDASSLSHSPEYQQFVDATGIVPERDIDSAAVALHRVATVPSAAPRRPGERTPSAELFVSEVFIGRFDGQRLAQYLGRAATARENYGGRDIYSVPIDGQTVRVAQLGYDTIAASNMPTAEQVHSMIDRQRASALWTPGSSLLAARYSEVPLLSQVWAIGHIGLPFSENGHISVMGLQLPLSEDTDLVASLRYSGSVHLRIEEFAPTEDVAKHTVETMTTLLGIFRGIQDAQPAETPGAQAMRKLIDSIELKHDKDRAVLTAVATTDEIHSMAAAANAPPPQTSPPAAASPVARASKH